MASFFVWKKRDFIQVLCSEIVNFSSMVSLWIIFSILGAVQHAVEGHFFQNYARDHEGKSAKIYSRDLTRTGNVFCLLPVLFPVSLEKRKYFF